MKQRNPETYARELAEEYGKYRAECFEEELLENARVCQSPIESLMAMVEHKTSIGDIALPPSFHSPEGGIKVFPQIIIDRYRADFVAIYAHRRGGYAIGGIECDGHDYHDLTKEQAIHDRARDRTFQECGLCILRYTGSEIWRNPLKCAVDALGILEKRASDPASPRWECS